MTAAVVPISALRAWSSTQPAYPSLSLRRARCTKRPAPDQVAGRFRRDLDDSLRTTLRTSRARPIKSGKSPRRREHTTTDDFVKGGMSALSAPPSRPKTWATPISSRRWRGGGARVQRSCRADGCSRPAHTRSRRDPRPIRELPLAGVVGSFALMPRANERSRRRSRGRSASSAAIQPLKRFPVCLLPPHALRRPHGSRGRAKPFSRPRSHPRQRLEHHPRL